MKKLIILFGFLTMASSAKALQFFSSGSAGSGGSVTGLTNPLTASLNANSNSIINVSSLSFTNSTGVSSVDTGTNTYLAVIVNGTTQYQYFDRYVINAATVALVRQYDYIYLTHPHFIASTSNNTINTTSTTYKFGEAAFSNSASSQTNCAAYSTVVPEDIDTAINMSVARFKFTLGNTDTGTHRYVVAYYLSADSANPPASLGVGTNGVNLDFAGDASGASGDIETITNVTLTNWATNMVAGRHLVVEVCRDGDAAQDASTVDSTSGALVIKFARTLTNTQ
jgi:hypothetical protein